MNAQRTGRCILLALAGMLLLACDIAGPTGPLPGGTPGAGGAVPTTAGPTVGQPSPVPDYLRCDPQELAFPLLPDARNCQHLDIITNFQTALAPNDVIVTYHELLAKEGWARQDDGALPGTGSWVKGARQLHIIAVVESGATAVQIQETGAVAAVPTKVPREATPTPTNSATSAIAPGIPSAMFPNAYDTGNPTLQDLWVDPLNGRDDNSGATRAQALRTIAAAWERVPMGTLTGTGYRILLVAGDYPADAIPGWLASRYGSLQFPLIFQAADGPHTARLHGYLDINDIRYLYLINLDMVTDRGYGGGSNVIHIAGSDHILIRGCRLDGFDGQERQPQETLKVNQTQHLYVEDSDIAGAFWFSLDWVAVQYGHILSNRIHNSGDHCAVLKGGSAYLRVEGNEIADCGVNGFMAGQGTGFEFMVSPWLHYEAYDVKFVNNVVHDTQGAGMGVNGGYNILLAYNTLYRVGANSHLLEVAFGSRSCDGDAPACAANLSAGGWGTTVLGAEGEPIPNRNVFIYNNIIYNPAGYQSGWQHFAVYGPRTPSPGSGTPSPAVSDANLQIRGNLIWNGDAGMPLGIEDPSQGCQDTNPACNSTQLLADNTINTVEPQLVNPAGGDFRPVAGGNVYNVATYAIPDYGWGDAPAPPPVPAGDLSNRVPADRAGHPRATPAPPGAYTVASGNCLSLPPGQRQQARASRNSIRGLTAAVGTVAGYLPVERPCRNHRS